jgi:hypothetical protein
MTLAWVLIAVLGVWRITHLLVAEDGPADIMVKFRALFGQGFFAKLLDCFYCASLWVALPFAFTLGGSWPEQLMLWPALSGGAILADRLIARAERPALYVEHADEGNAVEHVENDDVLRK